MRGAVKWFSKEKGYGFVTGDDEVERYFNVQQVQGTELPDNGYVIDFEPSTGNKGPRALKIKIVSKPTNVNTTNQYRDDRISCPSCGKKIVPRIIRLIGEVFKGLYVHSVQAQFKDLALALLQLLSMETHSAAR